MMKRILAFVVYGLFVEQAIYADKCPYEGNDSSVQGYSYGYPKQCVTMVNVVEAMHDEKDPYEATVEKCKKFKRGYLAFIDKHFKPGPFWKFVKRRYPTMSVLNGWKLKAVDWDINMYKCAADAIGCSYINLTLSVNGRSDEVFTVRMHHSTFELALDIDLLLTYSDLLKLLLTGMDDSLCAVLRRDETTNDFGMSELTECHDWEFSHFMCASEAYKDCSFRLSTDCIYNLKRQKCFLRNNYVVSAPAEKPYGKCPVSRTDYRQTCVCNSCVWTVWSPWATMNASCGMAYTVRYRPRDGMDKDACKDVNQRQSCCTETKTAYLGSCVEDPWSQRLNMFLLAFFLGSLLILLGVIVCSRLLWVKRPHARRAKRPPVLGVSEVSQELEESRMMDLIRAETDQGIVFGEEPYPNKDARTQVWISEADVNLLESVTSLRV